MITGHTTISFKDHINWYFADLTNFRLAAIIGTIIGLIMALRYSELGLGGMAIVFSTGLLFMLVFTAPVTLALYGLMYYKMSPEQKSIHWDINQERILITDEVGNQILSPWVEITKVIRKPKGWVLRRRVGNSQWIPARAFTLGMASQFEALINP